MRNIGVLILLIFIVSCQSNNSSNNRKSSNEKVNNDSIKYCNLISKTIDLPELQQYYKVQEVIKQDSLVILYNNFTERLGKIVKFNKPVVILDSARIKKNHIKAFLEYKDISIKNDTAKIYYIYDVQGVGIKSTYHYLNGQWLLIDNDLWEN
ncbi:MAG TPA: hypothetical protein VIK55_07400 [Paludibacter sp.]